MESNRKCNRSYYLWKHSHSQENDYFSRRLVWNARWSQSIWGRCNRTGILRHTICLPLDLLEQCSVWYRSWCRPKHFVRMDYYPDEPIFRWKRGAIIMNLKYIPFARRNNYLLETIAEQPDSTIYSIGGVGSRVSLYNSYDGPGVHPGRPWRTCKEMTQLWRSFAMTSILTAGLCQV